jgi:1-pyrroline-5-carboxylate dehydrogenase
MAFGIFTPPVAKNEVVRAYAPGSAEAISLQKQIEAFRNQVIDIPMFIGGKEVRTGNTQAIAPPHDHQHVIAHFHKGDASHVQAAIEASLKARAEWEALPWEQRAAIFLRMADLLQGPYRDIINASTMLGQSKNPFQAEIDAACELIDFFKFNVQYMVDLYGNQPESLPLTWNRLEYRPLEGFVFALTPFNFTSIAGNLPTSPAMMGNTVVWKPSNTQIYSAYWLMRLFQDAGLPDGVINLVYVSGPVAGDVIFAHPDFAGIHFTGSTGVFQDIWKTIGNNIHKYKSADVEILATAISRGAFEFQGQKCSAASRAYIPASLWEATIKRVKADLADMKMGGVEDFTNFINAVIDEKSFDKLASFIERAKADGQEIVAGGKYDKSKGYFIEPTIIRANDPQYITMSEELFGPVFTVYVYEDDKYEEILDTCDRTSIYALTGAVIAQDRYAIDLATERLRHAAGNFYINDKPTGAVVGQQPFGGARGSGTNDKAGSMLNLIRWVSARTVKENLNPPKSYRYPFQG